MSAELDISPRAARAARAARVRKLALARWENEGGATLQPSSGVAVRQRTDELKEKQHARRMKSKRSTGHA